MNWPSLKQFVSILATTFVGGAEGYLVTHLSSGLPDSKTQWEAMGASAALAGLAALVHLYQNKPGMTLGTPTN